MDAKQTIILVIDIQHTKQDIRIDAILHDLVKERSKRHSACVLHKAPDANPRDFQILNQLFRDAQTVVAHTGRDTRHTLSSIKGLIHCYDRPWISTMDDFPWPGMDEIRQTKAALLNSQGNAWLKMSEICKVYGIHYSQKKTQNRAVTLLNCLLKVPNLQETLTKCKTI
jgi:hypothetical protein